MPSPESPPQFPSMGRGKDHGLPPKLKLFVTNLVIQPVVDVDRILLMVPAYYESLGVPPEDQRKIANKLKARLYDGTKREQQLARNGLLSIGRAMGVGNIPPNGERIR